MAWLGWDGLDIAVLRADGYEAWVLPAMGGNVLRFAHEGLGVEALRVPADAKALRAAPAVYGTPLLFPPNRIFGGAFTFEGRAYRFPINEPSRNSFIHGFLMETPMMIAEAGSGGDEVMLSLLYRATADVPYGTFPHAFSVRLALRLGAGGLSQAVTVTNESREAMPVGLGFHTAFYIPRARRADFRVRAPVGREWLTDPSTIRPNGRYAEGTPLHAALNNEGLPPLDAPVSNLFERAPGAASVLDLGRGTEICYRADDAYRFWMLWNQAAQADHFCIEPMTWTVDAPNSPLPPQESGFDSLPPGKARTLVTRLSIRALSRGGA